MVGVKDVDQMEVVKEIAHFLKKSGKVKLPNNNDIIKLGWHKELAPMDLDWYYTRCAAVARHLYWRSTGLGGLTKIFGGKQRRGYRPNKYVRAPKPMLRRAFQALEAIKWVEKNPTGGRQLSSQGRKDLDLIAGALRQKQVVEPF